MISRGMMERQLYANGTIPDIYENPITNLADRIGVTTDEARRIINTMENPYKMMDMLPPNPREEFKAGGISNLKQARDVLEAQALPGEFLAYINPEEAKFLQYMGGAGIPINSSGIPSYFGGIGKAFKSVVKGVTGAAKSAVGAVKDFAKSDIGQIALSIAAPYALGVPFGATGTSIFGRLGIAGNIGGSAFLGNALRAGIGNLAVQGLTRGRFDLGQAAKAGIIQGGIQTGFQNYKQTGNLFKSGEVPTTSVAEGSEILYDTDVTNPYAGKSAEQIIAERQVQTAPDTFDTFAGQTIGPVQSTEQSVMGLDYGGPEYTASTLPETGTDTMKLFSSDAAAAENLTKPGTASTFGDVDLDVGLPPMPPTVPQAGQDAILKEYLSNAPVSERINLATRDFFGVDEAQDFINNPSLKTAFNFAKENPSLLISSASLLSALSVPKQPEETDFDYEERMRLVNDYASYYGERAGVDMSGAGDIEDYETYYSQRAGVAKGGSPKVPTGNVRENQAGIMELDYRDTGGRVPIGIKERADDVPAMLSKDEFVFTSKAVKNAGNGDVDKGAERLYKVMNILENGGTV